MTVQLSDTQIATLIAEPKPLPAEYEGRLSLRDKPGHKERELSVTGMHGSEFVVILRQSEHNHMDFSVILGYRPPEINQIFRLRRYNGKSHEHTNKLENQKFYDFHIHEATERYQQSGFREDTFACPTDRYANFAGALECLFDDCGFERGEDSQLKLGL